MLAVAATPLLQQHSVAAVAKLLSLGERPVHAILHPPALARPGRAGVFSSKGHRGHVTVAGTDTSTVEGDESFSQQQRIAGLSHEPGMAILVRVVIGAQQEVGETTKGRSHGARLGNSGKLKGGGYGCPCRPGAAKAQRQGPVGVPQDDAFLAGRVDNDVASGSEAADRQVRRSTLAGASREGVQDWSRSTVGPAQGRMRCRQRRINERNGGPTRRHARRSVECGLGSALF